MIVSAGVRHDELSGIYCSIAQTWSVVGERWTMLIVREAFLGVRRYEELRTRLDVSRNVLSDRLRLLTEEGILVREQYADRPERFEYRLTRKGLDLYPILLSLVVWGDTHKVTEPPVRYVHRTCGHHFRPQLACDHCGERLDPRQVTPEVADDAFTRVPEKLR